MAKEKNIRLEYHLKLNGRNPRHIKAALALSSVDNRYKSSFIALAIEHYMQTHPFGISLEDLMGMYRQSDRTYQPKIPIVENLPKPGEGRQLTVPPDTEDSGGTATSSAIDKAMDFYGV